MRALSKYTINFDERCTGWCAETKYNRMFVMHLENWFNDLLRSRGGGTYFSEMYMRI